MNFYEKQIAKAVWAQETEQSWYKDENGRVTTLWPHHFTFFWSKSRKFHPELFDIKKILHKVKV